ncbi:MAG: dipeptidyl aminopeptidase/acylaminoacyl peptidase [Cyclobacteriaceae bacterium]|jgi:dipeptidyl aminopeptidase/acylaminoacyl peptidase
MTFKPENWMLCAWILLSVSLLSCTSSPPKNHGKLDLELFLGEGANQPLVVGFGGGEGGNAWAGDYWETTRNEFLDAGFAFLAVGYFGSASTPAYLDRISLDAIRDSILNVAKNPKIDGERIAVIGGSKGGELVLNLASVFGEINAVVAMVPSHVSFPANTILANNSSWTYHDVELPYVPATFATISPALRHDLHEAFSIMLRDEEAVERALIPVEKINGSILLVSASADEMWPSAMMAERVFQRLKEKQFRPVYKHVIIDGGHMAPTKHFDLVLEFLKQSLKE